VLNFFANLILSRIVVYISSHFVFPV